MVPTFLARGLIHDDGNGDNVNTTTGQDWPPLGEEIANSISHGAGLLAVLIATPLLLTRARRHGALYIVGCGLFALSLILLYTTSTLYHALPAGGGKRVFQIIEHAAIFALIAGTYSPFTLGTLRGALGWTLFGVIWALAGFGIVLKAVDGFAYPALSTGLYLAMGWTAVAALPAILARVSRPGLYWLLTGGCAYSLGVGFFLADGQLPFGHFVWHLFVLAGTACHGVAVYRYAAKTSARNTPATVRGPASVGA